MASVNSGRSRKIKDAEKVFREAYNQNGKMPNQIITDKYGGYQEGVRKVFYPKNWGNQTSRVKHTSILGQKRIVNNNAVESHHSQQKEFHKTRRGITRTQDYADGFKVFHNFVRKNVKDKTTPAEKWGISIEKNNKWEGLLLAGLENGRQQKN